MTTFQFGVSFEVTVQAALGQDENRNAAACLGVWVLRNHWRTLRLSMQMIGSHKVPENAVSRRSHTCLQLRLLSPPSRQVMLRSLEWSNPCVCKCPFQLRSRKKTKSVVPEAGRAWPCTSYA